VADGDRWVRRGKEWNEALRENLPAEFHRDPKTVRRWLSTGSLALPLETMVNTLVTGVMNLCRASLPTKQARAQHARRFRHHADEAEEAGAPPIPKTTDTSAGSTVPRGTPTAK
jgi:hypothetical protein